MIHLLCIQSSSTSSTPSFSSALYFKLCEPSQTGGSLVCLHVQKKTFLDWKSAAIKGSLVTTPQIVIKKPIKKKLITIKTKIAKQEIGEEEEDDVFPVKGGYID